MVGAGSSVCFEAWLFDVRRTCYEVVKFEAAFRKSDDRETL